MSILYDKNPIPYEESYYAFNRVDMGRMSPSELREEMKKTKARLKAIEEEIALSDSETPSFVLRDQRTTAKDYLSDLKDAYSVAVGMVKESAKETLLRAEKLYKDGKLTKEQYEAEKRRAAIAQENERKYQKDAEEKQKKKLEETEYRKKHPVRSYFKDLRDRQRENELQQYRLSFEKTDDSSSL